MSFNFGRFALLAVISSAVCVSPLFADSLNVYVGYADNLRASGFFPSVWMGDPNVVSQSPASQTFDSGAIRIDNTGPTSITISNFSVYFPSINRTYAIWNPLVIGAGQTGIFAQFNGSDSQFDGSDFGAFGGVPPANLDPNNADHNGNTNLIGGCSSPTGFMTSSQLTTCNNTVPVISFNENGTLMSFSDTGHVLDTGEYDFVNNSAFGEDGNESINWNTIGSSVRGGTSGAPEPASLTLLSGGVVAGGLALLRRKKSSSR